MKNTYSKLFFLLMAFIIALNTTVVKGYTTLLEYVDYENLAKIEYIEAHYLISQQGKTAIEIIKYDFTDFIITEEASGEYCSGSFKMRLKPDLSPVYVETKYISSIDKFDYDEKYYYSPNQVEYKNLKNNSSQIHTITSKTADSIFLQEIICFSKLSNYQNTEAEALIVPNLTRIGFIFNYVKKDVLEINGKKHNTLVFEAKVSGILGFFISIFGSKAQIWLLEDFPHLRAKSSLVNKALVLQSYSITYKTNE